MSAEAQRPSVGRAGLFKAVAVAACVMLAAVAAAPPNLVRAIPMPPDGALHGWTR